MTLNKKWTQVGDLLVDLDYWNRNLLPQPNGCIYWSGGRHVQGYGMIGGKRVSDNHKIMTTTHRLALKIRLNRDLLPGHIAIHSCGDMQCCNPDHIYEGTRKDIGHQTLSNMSKPAARYTIEEMKWALTATDEEILARWADHHSIGSKRHTAKWLRVLFTRYLTRLKVPV